MLQRLLKILRRPWYHLFIVLCHVVGFWLAWCVLPQREKAVRQRSVIVEGQLRVLLHTDSGAVIVADTAHIRRMGVWVNRHWWLPSCHGTLLTAAPSAPHTADAPWPRTDADVRTWLQARLDSTDKAMKRTAGQLKETNYYMRSHNVQDEGYDRVAGFVQRLHLRHDSLQRRYALMQKALHGKHLTITMQADWYTIVTDKDGQSHTVRFKPTTHRMNDTRRTMSLQTTDGKTPKGLRGVSLVPWTSDYDGAAAVMTCTPQSSVHDKPLMAQCRIANGRLTLPHPWIAEGTVVFTRHGYFVGIMSGGRISR